MHRGALVLLLLCACDDGRGRTVPPGNTNPSTIKPSCSLPICDAVCACDVTTACDTGCQSCDPECKMCRASGVECVTPRDAGPTFPDAAPMSMSDAGPMSMRDASPTADAAPRVDAGPCMVGASQGLSQPCCILLGIDACGAGLFCEAFDGRTQATCYAERSRQRGETCSDDRHCSGGRCPQTTRRCGPGPGDPCGSSDTCAPDAQGNMFMCLPGINVCGQAPRECDLVTGQPCTAVEYCDYVDFTQETPEVMCRPTGLGTQGSHCDSTTFCPRSFTCFTPAQECLERCSNSDPCSQGSCSPHPNLPNGEGICIRN